jgi:hypothetical protein
LAAVPRQALSAEYSAARGAALIDTGLPDRAVPRTCPFTVEQVLDTYYLPE